MRRVVRTRALLRTISREALLRLVDDADRLLHRIRCRLGSGTSDAGAQVATPYGELWRPRNEQEAMALILNEVDTEVFERTGEADAAQLAPLIEPDHTVLDLGCGIGRVARYVAPRCRCLWAVDASEAMLAMARRRLDSHGNVRFAACEGTTIPAVADESVNLVYALLVLQHLEREDAFLLLREIRRVLEPGGTAVLTFPNLLSDAYLRSFLTYAETGETRNRSRARFYTPQEVERLLPAAGLGVSSLDAGVEIRVTAHALLA